MPQFQRAPAAGPARNQWAAWLIVGAVIAGPVLLGAALWRVFGKLDAPRYAKLWPPFTMVYVEESRDPILGASMQEATDRVVVYSEYLWRLERLRAGGAAREAGLRVRFTDGVLCVLHAVPGHLETCERISSRRAVTPINRQLDPTLYIDISHGWEDGGAWREVPAKDPDRIAFRLVVELPCGAAVAAQGGPRPCAAGRDVAVSESYIEFDRASLVPPYTGGVAVYAEKRINGMVH